MSTDNGASWGATGFTGWDPGCAVSDLVRKDSIIVAATCGGFGLSTDLGASWTKIPLGVNVFLWRALVVKDSCIFAGGSWIYRSTDNGTSWVQVASIHGVTALAANLSYVYAGSYGTGPNCVFRSSDDGTSWSPCVDGLTNSDVSALLAVGDSTVFAGTDAGVYRSTDNAGHWTYTGPTGQPVSSLAVIDSNIFAGTLSGIFLSTDSGSTWRDVTAGAYMYDVEALAVKDGFVFAGMSPGIARRALSEITEVPRCIPDLPVESFLSQNYPNPFNPYTQFDLVIRREAYVEVTVIDLLGQKVATVVAQVLQPGTHRMQWNASGVATGIYLARLNVENSTYWRKLLLLR